MPCSYDLSHTFVIAASPATPQRVQLSHYVFAAEKDTNPLKFNL